MAWSKPEEKGANWRLASQLVELLVRQGDNLVLAESCTCGLVAAKLGAIPGVSKVFGGSMVVYQNSSKRAWLNVDSALLEDPERGAVSLACSESLVEALRGRASHATVVAAITGHLGPDESERAGWIYMALQRNHEKASLRSLAFRLQTPSPEGGQDVLRRQVRQEEAADRMLDFLLEHVRS